ncbi:uncharacterized protein DC041_0011419 [Schistosoma bovis]|uniref:Solute carrier family 3 member 2 N-terminal domain-containing protein n=1 Tax=Schistosoma bovis TaxID=6184 RepID=A0A430Q8J0_SCHBO|nr:uncharacterized protein DC041_0011419 [Schistosoma bovis]
MNQQETTTKISIDKEYRQYDYSKNFDKTLTEEQEEDPTNCSSKLLEHQSQLESRLLTCEDLINLDKIEPRWRYIRIGLLIGFGIIFFGLLAACIVYIIVGEKCPSVPKLPFWKSTVGYWLDVFAFKDSSGDLVGDLNGNELLAVNSGDTGCGVGDNPDPMLMFRDVADLIISREFVWGRGEKERELTFNQTALQKYLTYTDSDKEILGLTTSTVHIPPYGDTLQLATTLLLPGLPVIYYGTEIDVNRVTLHYLPQSIYPKGKTYNDEPFDKYSSVLSHMPMPWDFNGKRFSATINDSRFRDYLNDYNNKKVVESELAEGNDKSVLRLVQKLVALRQNPSIKWGTMEQINIDQHFSWSVAIAVKCFTCFLVLEMGEFYVVMSLLSKLTDYFKEESVSHAEAFARKAKGFPTFIVVLVKYFKEDYFLDLTSVCSSITPRHFRWSIAIAVKCFTCFLVLEMGEFYVVMSLLSKLTDYFKEESVSHAEAFARKAKGFPTFIVVLVKYFKEDYFLDLTSVCSSITPRVIYPSHPQLSVDNALSTSKIFIPKLIYSSYILVFECN